MWQTTPNVRIKCIKNWRSLKEETPGMNIRDRGKGVLNAE